MINIDLTEEQLRDINEALDNPEIGERKKIKLLCIKHRDMGISPSVVAGIFMIDPNTVTAYVKDYLDGGISTSIEDRAYGPVSEADEHLETIRESLTEKPVSTAAEASERILQLTGRKFSVEQVRRIMKKIGFKCIKAGQVPGKADRQLQLEFYEDELKPRMDDAAEGDGHVLFVDASHFVMGCYLGNVWCSKRIFIRSSSGRKRFNVLGALDSQTKEVITVRKPGTIGAVEVCELLDKIRERYPEGMVTLVMDNASYQRAGVVVEHAERLGLDLLFLPAYSPNLNLIERLWRLAEKACLRNEFFDTFDAFKETIIGFLDNLHEEFAEELESLITEKFQILPEPIEI